MILSVHADLAQHPGASSLMECDSLDALKSVFVYQTHLGQYTYFKCTHPVVQIDSPVSSDLHYFQLFWLRCHDGWYLHQKVSDHWVATLG